MDGDEIFLFGFSRGAYTARAIGGLIARIGFLHKTVNFQQVYASYQKRQQASEAALPGADGIQSGFRATQRIKAIGVWDTVGSLGVPGNERTYAFHDTTISESKFI